MADHVDQVNMNGAMLPGNTFSVKEEKCQQDSFVEDKVYISETSITEIKQYEESTYLDNIKTELTSFDVTQVQNDKVKSGGGFNAKKIKMELDNNRLLYCEHCEAYYVDYCIECGMLGHILNKYALNGADNRAREDIPDDILEIQDSCGQIGIYALRIIPAGVKFGPFTGLSATECLWQIKEGKFLLDRSKSRYLNWMEYINPTENTCNQNLQVFQSENNIYYQSTRQIQVGDELLVYLGDVYGNSSNKIIKVNFVTTTKDVEKDIFACTFCCLGFRLKSHLAKHKTVCVKDRAGKFLIEELMQCPFCKIHLDPKEYVRHHMTFCCERNARESIISMPPAKETATTLNARKSCLRQTYKCEQCRYRTKYQAVLREHIRQHYEIKIYKCGICNRRFKTEEILRLHMANTHVLVGGKDGEKRYTTDYKNINIKVEQSSSPDQKEIFKCSLCVFRAKHKPSLRRHIKTKHLEEFDFKCDKCEYRTNYKNNSEKHMKTKHLKKFDYKCNNCEFGTNRKGHLERHTKTKHFKEYDFKCDL